MAERIRKKGGKCGKVNRSTVWRIIQRLGIEPAFRHTQIALYTEADYEQVVANLRAEKSEKGE